MPTASSGALAEVLDEPPRAEEVASDGAARASASDMAGNERDSGVEGGENSPRRARISPDDEAAAAEAAAAAEVLANRAREEVASARMAREELAARLRHAEEEEARAEAQQAEVEEARSKRSRGGARRWRIRHHCVFRLLFLASCHRCRY